MTFDAQIGPQTNRPMSDERYQQRQQKVKIGLDARVARAEEPPVRLVVFTGNGK